MPWPAEGPVALERELRWLERALTTASNSTGSCAFVAGGPGSGKTRLLQACASAAASSGFVVAKAHGPTAASGARYGPIAELLTSLCHADPSLLKLEEVVRGPLAGLAPGATSPPSAWPPAVVGDAVLRAVARAAERVPVLLVLDDAHRVDEETVAVVEYIMRYLAGIGAVALVALRPSPCTATTLVAEQLERDDVAPVFRLAPLGQEDVEVLLRRAFASAVPRDVVDRVVERTAGTPGAVLELVAAAGGEIDALARLDLVPRCISEAIEVLVGEVPRWTVPVAEAKALLGEHAPAEVVAVVADVDVRVAADALALLGERGLTSPAAGRAIVAAMEPATRRAVAAAALGRLERGGGTVADTPSAAALARHAGEAASAARYGAAAARGALARGDIVEAEAIIGYGLPGVDEADVLDVRLRLLAVAGRVQAAVGVGDALIALLTRRDAPARDLAAAHLMQGSVLAASTRRADAAAHLEAARMLARACGDPALSARVQLLREELRWRPSHVGEVEALCSQLDDPDVVADALDLLGRQLAPTDPTAAAAAFRREVVVSQRNGRPLAVLRARLRLARLHAAATFDVADLRRERDLAAARGAVAEVVGADVALGAVEVVVGDAEVACARLGRATEEARVHQLGDLAIALAWLARAELASGRPQRAEELLVETEALAVDRADVTAVLLGEVRAVIRLVHGDIEGARVLLNLAAEAAREAGFGTAFPFSGVELVLAAVAGRDPSDDVEPWTRLARGCAAYARAIIVGRQGDSEAAAVRVDDGDALLFPASWHHHLVRALAASCAAADGWGAPAAWLRAANAYFDDVGHSGLAAFCRRGLDAAGIPVPRHRGSTRVPFELAAFGITAREVEVLDLVREGGSRRDIAAALVVSEETVKSHLKNLFQKTGTRSRGELLATVERLLAAGSGPVDDVRVVELWPDAAVG